MKNYVIIDADTIQKRIEELEWSLGNIPESYIPKHEAQIYALKELLSQSTPLIPQIEKAYNTGTNYGIYLQGGSYDPNDNIDIEDYISKLKLDI